MEDIQVILEGLVAEKAKRREATILKLSPEALRDERVIAALERILATDVQGYARTAAYQALVKAGKNPSLPDSAALGADVTKEEQAERSKIAANPALAYTPPSEPQKENPLVLAVGVVVGVLVLCGVIYTLVTVVGMAGEFGNIFSRVTNGLGSP